MSRWRCKCGYIIDNRIFGGKNNCPECNKDTPDLDWLLLSEEETTKLWLRQQIPTGYYCYFGTRGARGDYRPCPYWKYVSEHCAKCKLLNISDEDDGVLCLWDQVKECDFK